MKTIRALSSLNPYFGRYGKHLAWGTFVVILANIFQVFQPGFVRHAVDAAEKATISGNALDAAARSEIYFDILLYSAGIFGVTLIRGIFLFFSRQTLIVMSHLITNDLRNDVYSHLQKLSLSFFRRNRTGDLMARSTEDISRVRMYIGPGVMYNLNTATTVIFVVIQMFRVSPHLAWYALLPLPVLSLMIYLVENVVTRKSDKIQEQLSMLTSFTQEVYSGIRLVKGYVREKSMQGKMHDESERYKQRQMSLARLESLFHPMVMALVGLSNILVVYIGGKEVMAGTLSKGNIVEFLLYVNMLTWPIISLGWMTTQIQRAAASQERINKLLREVPEIEFPLESKQIERASLAFEEVSFTYPETGIQALKKVSFNLEPGKKLGILGHTGSGKTTLCHLIPRLMDPEWGRVMIEGRNAKEYSRDALRNAIGYCPQDVFLFSDTLNENISFGVEQASPQEIEDAAKDASVYENIIAFPDGFKTMIGERGVTLSGGQKQRVAIARAMIRKPKFLILDDSLSAVDTRTEEEILIRLRQARIEDPSMGVIMVSHRISTLQDSDMILVLKDGAVIERGTHSALLEKAGYYASTFKKQQIEKELSESAPI